MSPNQLSDKELWDSIARDNAQAFEILYNRYWKKVYKTASYFLKNEDLAEQILHDAFVALWDKRKSLVIKNFDSYIFITVKYYVFKHLKKAKKSIVEYVDEYVDQYKVVDYNNGDLKLNREDIESYLDHSLIGLPKRCKEIFLLSRVGNYSNDEIANQLCISKRTVENQLTYALKHLRDEFKELSIGFSYQ